MEGGVVWLIGPRGTGKSAVAALLRDELTSRDVPTLLLDGDDLEPIMAPRPTHDEQEQDVFYATIGRVAELSAEGGSVVLIAAVAPKRLYRDCVRARVEVFVEVLLVGDSEAAFEDPVQPELVFDSGSTAPTEIALAIVRLLEKRAQEHDYPSMA